MNLIRLVHVKSGTQTCGGPLGECNHAELAAALILFASTWPTRARIMIEFVLAT